MERDVAEDVALVRDFLAPWLSADAPTPEDTDEEQDINLLQASFQHLERRVNEAKDVRAEIKRCRETIKSIKQEIEGNLDETGKVFTECELEPDAHIELDARLGLLDEWKAKREALQKAEFEEERIRSLLEAHPDVVRQIEEGRIADLRNDHEAAGLQAGEYSKLIEQRAEITTRLSDAGKDHKLSRARAAVDSARASLQDKREQAWLFEATELLLDDVEQAFHSENEPEVLSRSRALYREITANAFNLELDKNGMFYATDLKQNALRTSTNSHRAPACNCCLRYAWPG